MRAATNLSGGAGMAQQEIAWLVMVGKWMILTLFLVAGVMNLAPARVKDHIDRMAGFGVPLPAFAFWFGLAMQFTGCALLIAGWQVQLGVWLLIAFTAIAGGIFHRYWLVADPMRRHMLRIALLNNVAVIGGLLVLLYVLR
jgi:putative oxidoreductase